MKTTTLLLLLLLPAVVIAQNGINITGRVSLRTTNVDYNESSSIKPDSIPNKDYGKTNLIPGLQQAMNIALFARTNTLDMTLLGDFHNDKWNNLNTLNAINRLSFSLRFAENEIVLGDFYETGSDFFIQSREVRGAKVRLKFDDLWNARSFIDFKSSFGIAQKAFAIGSRLEGSYKQYETAGLFQRNFASGQVHVGETNRYSVGLNYIYAIDDNESISESLNDPFKVQDAGLDGSVYLFKEKVKLFGEGYFSSRDTIDAGKGNDLAWKGGMDLRLDRFKLITLYQHIGYNYYTAGYPYLLTDRQGIYLESAYSFPRSVILNIEGEIYNDNLKDFSNLPTTKTRRAEISVTTNIRKWPEITFLYGFRDDLSNSLFDADQNETKTNKITRKYESSFAYSFAYNRISASAILLDLKDASKIVNTTPLGTQQFISTLNFYTRPNNTIFISGGAVYSRLLLSDGNDTRNIFAYQSSRFDLIRQKLLLETNLNMNKNEGYHGGNDDFLNNYLQFYGQVSLEYFFNNNVSLKLISGLNDRKMRYTTAEAVQLLLQPDVDPTFFNGNETYNALIYGAEINWIF